MVGKPILIDENTRLGLSDRIAVAEVGAVEIRGKAQSVQVYAVQVGGF